VEKFEERRAAGQGAAAPPQQQQQQQQQQQEQQQPDAQQKQQAAVVPWARLALQLLQLALTVAALILWPASLSPAGLHSGRVWWAALTYLAFFAGGSVWRLVRFGPLASRQQDAQAKSAGSRAAQALFIASMPLLHWGAVGSFLKRQAARQLVQQQQQMQVAVSDAAHHAGGAVVLVPTPAAPSLPAALSLYDVLGFVMLVAAVALNWAAARHLGRAYDRVVAPAALVTTGPYSYVQHPIYSSYMLLFAGYAMWMHAWPVATGFVAVCLVYYRSRTRLEGAVLQAAFGQEYSEYAARTRLFVPFVL
jgi:protein-S-isoprenylcysteine O-methyltransferase Ste14